MENAIVDTPAVETTPSISADMKFNAVNFAILIGAVVALSASVEALSSKNRTSSETREMTSEDAKNVLNGETKELSHKEAGAKLNLSYGQVYSCRLGHTFKGVHKELKETGFVNKWIK